MRKSLLVMTLLLSIAAGAMAQSTEDEFNELDAVRENLISQAELYKFESKAKIDQPVVLSLHKESLLNLSLIHI